MQILDLVLLILLVVIIFRGWRDGFLTSVLFSLGMLLGLLVGVLLLPKLFKPTLSDDLRLSLLIFTLGIFIFAGGFAGLVFGKLLRINFRSKILHMLDATLGALIQVTIFIFVLMLLIYPLKSANNPTINSTLAQSKIVTKLETIAPDFGEKTADRLKDFFKQAGFPDLSDSLTILNGALPEPDLASLQFPQVKKAVNSVVKVKGYAWSCERLLSGSGYVIAPNKIITNAHVVAGAKKVEIQTRNGRGTVKVTYFNPDDDIAILTADNLTIPAIPLATQLARAGEVAVALGFPGGGEFKATNVRVKGIFQLDSNNIYYNKMIIREVYAINGDIKHGNSGGPLVNQAGQVLGIVFAAARDAPHTGFALTNEQVSQYIAADSNNFQAVETGKCAV